MRLPDYETQRLSIVGRTGSGKTQAAVWHFSHAPWDVNPWVVYDFKRDRLLAEIGAMQGVEHIETDYVPRRPGIYFVHPHPDDTIQVQDQLMHIWEQQSTGVLVDEGYMVSQAPNSRSWLRTLLTQGRSLRIPMIILSQRPVWMDRFVFSESDFYQVFRLNHAGDRRKIGEYIPADLSLRLPEYHSFYHDVSNEETYVMRPVPKEEDLLQVFSLRLEEMRSRKRRYFI
jgi:hypothetical protein